MGEHALLLLCGLVLDWFIGDPVRLWQRLPHPVAGFGKIIDILDSAFNSDCDAPVMAMRKGSLAISLLIIAAIVMGLILNWLNSYLAGFGSVVEVLVIWVFLAQKNLLDHVGDVARGLREDGLEGGRQAVSLIVGRDPQMLDESGICRAAIETLAENFCDGVVAPAFWYLVFGLPGLFAYKMINTADSMIAYKNQRYLYFGRATAQIDDL
ncbi:MAG: adenosylcobinamide-phosphate synthase, partial [Chloroflexi bacterium]|nr:adenosylcobinamide-phosphate synthase [Chloroflexota bacterium]